MGKSQRGVVPGSEAFTLEDPSITRLMYEIDDSFSPSGAPHGAAIFHLAKEPASTARISQPADVCMLL